jgi:cytochrome c oxidase assembly protein subunit 15
MTLHRYVILVVMLALVAIVTGAILTSTDVAARQPQSAIPGGASKLLHTVVSIALGVFTLGLAIWISRSSVAAWLKCLAWCATALLAASSALGWQTSSPLPAKAALIHALLAHLFFSLAVVIAVATSATWNSPPERVDGSHKPFLRPLSIAIPPVVFFQIILGAAYRYELTSVLPHMGIAMGVAFLALIGSSVVLQNFPRPASLRHSAIALISLVLSQVCLGIGAFVMLVLNDAGNCYFIAVTVGHVLVGASTLAASIVMAMQVIRSVLPKQGPPL